MVRALWYLILVTIGVAVAVYLADRPGAVVLDWLGYRIETSFIALLVAVSIIAASAALLYRLWIFLRRAPSRVTGAWRHKRRQQGYQALTRGMVAVSAGEADEARRQVKRAEVLLDEPPLTMLLAAQTAQLEGDEKAAEKFFKAMAERDETEFLGVRGLLNQAIKSDDTPRALEMARRAYRLRPKSDWVTHRLFELQVRNRQWLDARVTTDERVRQGQVPGPVGRRQKAVLAYQLSRDMAAAGEIAQALRELKAAVDLDPEFVPAAAALAGALCREGRHRKAVTVLEKSWRLRPHPDLVEPYWVAAEAEDGLARVKALERLAEIHPEHVESRLAIALAALDAQLWGQAREQLTYLLNDGDDLAEARVCRLMARLEEAEHGDLTKAHDWMTRASLAQSDAAWICDACGNAVAEWSVLCGQCESFDSYVWRAPAHVVDLPGLAKTRALIAASD